MNRVALALCALLVVGSLTGCGEATSSAVPTTTEDTASVTSPASTSTAEATASTRASPAAPTGTPRAGRPARLQDLFTQTVALFAEAEALDGDIPEPDDADDANAVLHLGTDAPVRFAELTDQGDVVHLCLTSTDGAYLALSSEVGLRMLLGDGACTYTKGDAPVVGNLVSGKWTRGGQLMGDIDVDDFFPGGNRFDSHAETELAAPPMFDPQVLDGTTSLAYALERYAVERGGYPQVPLRRLIDTVARVQPVVGFEDGARVHAYLVRGDAWMICVEDGEHSWARWEGPGGSLDHGTYTDLDELTGSCARPLAP